MLSDAEARVYRVKVLNEEKMAFTHRVGRSLCMTMCTGLGLFLFAVGIATALSETRWDPCALEIFDAYSLASRPPAVDLGDIGNGILECTTPPVNRVRCVRNATTAPTDDCEAFEEGVVECPDSCAREEPEDVHGTGYIVLSQQPLSSRFPAWTSSGPSNFICVGWDGDSWVALAAESITGANRAFTPTASDVLVASYRGSDLTAAMGPPTYVSGAAAADRQRLGYASGDLQITAVEAVPWVPHFNVNGTQIVPHPPAVEPTPPPPPCHSVPPGGASSIGWFAFGSAILLMAIGIGGLRGGCKYEEVELEKSPESVVITITRRACMCIEAFRCQKCILRENVHTLSADVEAAQCDYEADGGLCSGAIRCGKSVVVANNFFENADGSVTQGLDVESTVQIWNGPPLSMSASMQLQKEINKFLNPDYVPKREKINFDGPEWHGTPRRDADTLPRGPGGHTSPPKFRRPRSPTRSTSSFGGHLRRPPRLPVRVREQRQKSMQQVKLADNDTLLSDLQQARDVQAQLIELRRQTIANGRPMTTELDMLLRNMEENMSQIENKLRLSGQEVPVNRSSSLTLASDMPPASTPLPPPGDARLNARPQALHQAPDSSASALPRPTGFDTGRDMELIPAGSAAVSPELSASSSQFQEKLADGLAGMAMADAAERAGEEGHVGSIDEHTGGNEQRPPQGFDDSNSSAEEDQAPQEQAQLLKPPVLAVDGRAVSGSAPLTASATESPAAATLVGADSSQSAAPAPPKATSIGGSANMLARLSAFKAQKAATAVAAPAIAAPQTVSPDEDVNHDQSVVTPAATDDSNAADVGEAREAEVAETVNKKLDAAADDAGTPLRPTTPPRRGQGAGTKSEVQKALAKKRAETRRKKAEAATKKAYAAAGEAPKQPEPEPEPEPEREREPEPTPNNDAGDTADTASTDAKKEERGERLVDKTDIGQSKRTDIAAAIAARKKAAGKKAALQSKSNRAGTPPRAKGTSDATKAKILAAKARKKKEASAQAKPDAAP